MSGIIEEKILSIEALRALPDINSPHRDNSQMRLRMISWAAAADMYGVYLVRCEYRRCRCVMRSDMSVAWEPV